VLLQGLVGLPTPCYHHHALIRDPEGDKLSKSFLSESLADLRARGVSAGEVRHRLGFA
jgi:glutamyl-Q tRNA(Asp) synthetase